MNFDNHDFTTIIVKRLNQESINSIHTYTAIAKSLDLESIKYLHTYNDTYLVQKVKCNLIICEHLQIIFEARSNTYGLRAFRVLKGDRSPKNFFSYSSIQKIQ